MTQIVLTVNDNTFVPKLKAITKMLQGVVSVKVIKDKEEEPMFNRETMEAIEEIRSGKYAGELDTTSKEALPDSIMAL